MFIVKSRTFISFCFRIICCMVTHIVGLININKELL